MLRYILAVSFLALGCGSGKGETLSLAQFTPAYAASFCKQALSCDGYAAYFVQGCSAALARAAESQFAQAVAAGRLAFDSGQARACVDALGALPCGSRATPQACAAALRGTVQPGGACYQDFDCDNGLCGGAEATCPSTCRFAGEGARCPCDSRLGLVCLNGKCSKPAAAGADCSSGSFICQDGLGCLPPGGVLPPVCTIPRAGAFCRVQDYCGRGYYCTAGLTNTGTCQPQLPRGSTCTSSGECAEGMPCSGTPGTCSAGEAGNKCNIEGDCRRGLLCNAGNCSLPPASGSCASDQAYPCQAYAAYCDQATSTCVTAKDDGAECKESRECKSGNCFVAPGGTTRQCGYINCPEG